MKILITGNLGYVGPMVVRHLRTHLSEAYLVGFDSAFFAHALSNAPSWPERLLNQQHFGDVRDICASDLVGFDAVVHLAAVSNDPMGNRFETVTDQINRNASLQLAERCKLAGVQRFVFASSCSVYGFAPGAARIETDTLNPQTAYARSKVDTELGLAKLDLANMTTTCLRFATACGMSDRLRLDLVLNDFVASAIAINRITILSDGTPWRPLIDVRDMARAVHWALVRPESAGGKLLSVNVGCEKWNYQVKDLAVAVAELISGVTMTVNTQAQPDTRSYKVDFSRFAALAPEFQPQITLAHSIQLLREGLIGIGFADAEFRSSSFMRLKILESHIASGRLSADLRWLDRLAA